MKRKWLSLIICSAGSASVLILLIWFGLLPKPKNGFNRHILKQQVESKKSIKLKGSQFYIAGFSSSTIYLGNYINTSLLLSCTYDLRDTQYKFLPSPDTGALAWGILHVQVDSPNIFLMEGLTPSIIHTNLSFSKSFRQQLTCNNFTACLFLSPSVAIVKSYDQHLEQDILRNQSIGNINHYPARYILAKQIDGRFSVDGMLVRSKDANRFFYVYFYRNEFFCLDSNLKLQYAAQTIDTNSLAKLHLGRIENDHKTTILSPPPTVNRKACTSDRYLIIYSGLRADNESVFHFKENAVIDLYSISDGRYTGSFYLKYSEGEKISSIGVFHHHLFVIHNDQLTLYKFPF